MNKLLLASSLAASLCIGAFAADFSTYTTEELLEMRGTVPVEDRADFKTELQDRISVMTPDEKALYDIGSRQGQGGFGDRLQDGSGDGRMNQGASRGGAGDSIMLQQRVQQRVQDRLRDGSGAGSMHQGAKGGR